MPEHCGPLLPRPSSLAIRHSLREKEAFPAELLGALYMRLGVGEPVRMK
jgi:hypothetical protein